MPNRLLPQPHILDLRSLALFRIGLGLYLCYDVISRTLPGVDVEWYSSPGFLHPDDSPHGNVVHKIWFARTTPGLQYCLFAITFLLSIGLSVGKLTTIQSRLLLWVLVVSLQHRNMHVHDGSDNYTRQLLLWFSLLPDTVHEQMAKTFARKAPRPSPNVVQVNSLACLGLSLQILLMYMGTIALRTIDGRPSKEWSSEWTAVHYVIRDQFAIRSNAFVEWLRQQPLWVTQSMTKHAMLAESSAIVWFLCPNSTSRIRVWGSVVLGTLHFGLLLVTRLPNWQFIGMIASVLWIPTCSWDRWQGISADWKKKASSKKGSSASSSSRSPSKLSPRRIWIYFYLSYSVYNFCGQRGWIAKHDGGDVGEFFRISQYWVMYASPPKSAVVTNILGYTRNGASDDNDDDVMVDAMHGIKTGQWSPDSSPITNETSLETVVSPRWERALDQWGRSKDRRRAQTLLKRLCHHIPENIARLELIWKYYQIVGPNSDGSIQQERWIPSRNQPDVVITVPCHQEVESG